MPNRIIKESICTSEEVDKLSPFQETFFYRLIVNCDDYGRMDARVKILKSKLYPLKDIRAEQIAAALEALASAELVILYQVDGKPFLQMKTWRKHQQLRAKKSKYPAPDNNGYHVLSDDSECPRNPKESESEFESNAGKKNNSARTREGEEPEEAAETDKTNEDDVFEFDAFWDAFPRKSGDIREARCLYYEAIRDGVTPEVLLEAATWQAEEKGQFMPSPEKWLRNMCWKEPKPSNGKGEKSDGSGASFTGADIEKMIENLDKI